MKARTLAVIAVLSVIGIAVSTAAVPPQPTRPLGEWSLAVDDGSTITLSFGEQGMTLKAVMPDKGTTTMTAPRYEIGDGVLFGYFDHLEWTDGTRSRQATDIAPFACRLSVNDTALTVSDVKILGADRKAQSGMSGTYHKK